MSRLLEVFVVGQLATLLPVSRPKWTSISSVPVSAKRNSAVTHRPSSAKIISAMHKKFAHTSEDGSRTLLHGAVAGKESHGQLPDSCEIAPQVTATSHCLQPSGI